MIPSHGEWNGCMWLAGRFRGIRTCVYFLFLVWPRTQPEIQPMLSLWSSTKMNRTNRFNHVGKATINQTFENGLMTPIRMGMTGGWCKWHSFVHMSDGRVLFVFPQPFQVQNQPLLWCDLCLMSWRIPGVFSVLPSCLISSWRQHEADSVLQY